MSDVGSNCEEYACETLGDDYLEVEIVERKVAFIAHEEGKKSTVMLGCDSVQRLRDKLSDWLESVSPVAIVPKPRLLVPLADMGRETTETIHEYLSRKYPDYEVIVVVGMTGTPWVTE